MTKSEIQELTIFLGNDHSFIGRKLKNGEPSKLQRVLTEQECMSFVTWFIRTYCKKNNCNEFTLNVNDVPTYRLGLVKEEKEENNQDTF